MALALYGNIGCGFSFLLIKKLSNFCQKVNKFKENFNIFCKCNNAEVTEHGQIKEKKTDLVGWSYLRKTSDRNIYLIAKLTGSIQKSI